MDEIITIDITRAEALVISNFLAKRINNPDIGIADIDLSGTDYAQNVAMNELLNSLEPEITDAFSSDYVAKLEEAKQHLINRLPPIK